MPKRNTSSARRRFGVLAAVLALLLWMVPTPCSEAGEPPVYLHVSLGGDPLSDPDIQEAILYAVSWEVLVERIASPYSRTGRTDIPVTVDVETRKTSLQLEEDARKIRRDPERARYLLRRSYGHWELEGRRQFKIKVIVSLDEESYKAVLEVLSKDLDPLEIEILSRLTIHEDEGRGLFYEQRIMDPEQAVMWLRLEKR